MFTSFLLHKVMFPSDEIFISFLLYSIFLRSSLGIFVSLLLFSCVGGLFCLFC